MAEQDRSRDRHPERVWFQDPTYRDPPERFLYGRQLVWPHPSAIAPMGLPPEVSGVPEVEVSALRRNVERRYFRDVVVKIPAALRWTLANAAAPAIEKLHAIRAHFDRRSLLPVIGLPSPTLKTSLEQDRASLLELIAAALGELRPHHDGDGAG